MSNAGRPTTYSKEIADSICEGISMGSSIRTVCAPESMPAISTFYKWLREHEEFSKQYARACEERTEAMAEDILDIADDGTNDYITRENKDGVEYEVVNSDAIQRSRLRVDTRKWLMSKMKPKKYGDKVDVTSGGEKITSAPLIISDIGGSNEAKGKTK